MKIIYSNGQYKIFGDSIEVFDELPANTYSINFDPQSGFSLSTADKLEVKIKKVYGQNQSVSDKVMRRFSSIDKGLGVALTGFKGSGKTLTAFMISEAFYDMGYPTIIVDDAYPGLFSFLTSIKTPCLVLFDEFEKLFVKEDYHDEDENEVSANLLTYLDGSGSGRKLNLLVSNSEHIGEFLINRPGRIYYKYNYTGLTPEEIAEYMSDRLSAELKNDVKSAAVAVLSNYSKHGCDISYDILSAIVSELNFGEPLSETMRAINFNPVFRMNIQVKVNGMDVETDVYYNASQGSMVEKRIYLSEGEDRDDLIIDIQFDIEELLGKGRVSATSEVMRGETVVETVEVRI